MACFLPNHLRHSFSKMQEKTFDHCGTAHMRFVTPNHPGVRFCRKCGARPPSQSRGDSFSACGAPRKEFVGSNVSIFDVLSEQGLPEGSKFSIFASILPRKVPRVVKNAKRGFARYHFSQVWPARGKSRKLRGKRFAHMFAHLIDLPRGIGRRSRRAKERREFGDFSSKSTT